MARKARLIILEDREKSLIQKELNRNNLEKHFDYRMKIVLYSSEGKSNKEISSLINYSEHVVSKWRKRWYGQQAQFKMFKEGVSGNKMNDKTLIKRIKDVLSDSYRMGRPIRISQVERDRLVALACEPPENFGLPFSNWTHEELAKHARKKGIEVSTSQAWRILKKRLVPA